MGAKKEPTEEAASSSLSPREIASTPLVEWYGHLPCVCESHQGCHRHNPTGAPIYRNPLLPPKTQVNVGNSVSLGGNVLERGFYNRAVESKVENLPKYTEQDDKEPHLFTMRIPFDLQSVQTLAPIHPNIPYHLAFYHLHTIRLRLDPRKRVHIPELSCKGEFYIMNCMYSWSNVMYFEDETFLQAQRVMYVMEKGISAHEATLVGCPHHSIHFSSPIFTEKDGFTEVEITYTGDRSRKKVNKPRGKWQGTWAGSQGEEYHLVVCKICHADTRLAFEAVNDEIRVDVTCFRDLGPGNDRNDWRWVALMAGVGVPGRLNTAEVTLRIKAVREALELEAEPSSVDPVPHDPVISCGILSWEVEKYFGSERY